MNRIWHLYDLSTGLFTGQYFSSAREKDVSRNTPPGYGAREGVRDPYAQRVDLETGELVDYQPPRPNDEYEWNTQRRRWQKRADVLRREAERAAAQTRLVALDAQQIRALAELAIDPTNAQARSELERRESEKTALRARLRVLDEEERSARARPTGTPADSPHTGSGA